jgi:two-component system, OmpR family, sensor kinase
MSRIGLRTRLFLVVVTAVAISVLALIVGFNFILARSLDHDSRSLAQSRAAAERSLVRVNGGRLTMAESPNDAAEDAYLWVFANGKAIEQPTAHGVVSTAAATLQQGHARFLDIGSADARLYAEPIVVNGRRLGTIVAGVSVAPYEQTRRLTFFASVVFGLLILALVAAAAWWTLALSLRPVRRMTRQAAAWSERELDHRFGLGEPRDELSELAATLDGLLDRIAASLRREQRFSAELSHELRTPLARVRAEAELALRREREPSEYRDALELIQRNTLELSRTLDALVAAARHETGSGRGTADAAAVVTDAIEALRPLAEERQVEVAFAAPDRPVRVGVESDLATRIVQPVLENAIRYSKSRVEISVARRNTAVRYSIGDDGPGVLAAEREAIFEPGQRGSAGLADGVEGSGLGLSLVRRLVHSVSGEVDAVVDTTGSSFVIDLPAG